MGIQFYNGLTNYGNYGYRDIPQVKPEEVKAAELNEPKVQEQPKEEPVASPSKYEQEQKSRIASLEDISLTFNKEESFEYLESDSSVKSLDMQKAISDMQKDTVLQEYQYFVGSSKTLFSDDDGIVIAKQQ